MIVYNVKRRWFAMKGDAEAYRKQEGLKPSALLAIRVEDREQLALLLNALCDAHPTEIKQAEQATGSPILKAVDQAYVDPLAEIPDFVPPFLIQDHDLRKRALQRLLDGQRGAS